MSGKIVLAPLKRLLLPKTPEAAGRGKFGGGNNEICPMLAVLKPIKS
jgi:hypothetical protein